MKGAVCLLSFQSCIRAVVNEIGPPLRWLLLSIAPWVSECPRRSPPDDTRSTGPISLHNAIGLLGSSGPNMGARAHPQEPPGCAEKPSENFGWVAKWCPAR